MPFSCSIQANLRGRVAAITRFVDIQKTLLIPGLPIMIVLHPSRARILKKTIAHFENAVGKQEHARVGWDASAFGLGRNGRGANCPAEVSLIGAASAAGYSR